MTLKEYRETYCLTQTDIAKKIKCSVSAISLWENGKFNKNIKEKLKRNNILVEDPKDPVHIINQKYKEQLKKENSIPHYKITIRAYKKCLTKIKYAINELETTLNNVEKENL